MALPTGMLLRALIAAALLPLPAHAVPTCEPLRMGPWSARSGAVAEGTVWEITEDGTLVTFRPPDSRRRVEPLPEAALAVCARERGEIAVLTCAASGDRWTLRVQVEGQWRPVVTFRPEGDRFVSLTCDDWPAVVTSRRRLYVERGEVKSIALPQRPGTGPAIPPPPGCDVRPLQPEQGSSLTRAVYAGARLWVRSDAGEVISLAEGESGPRTEPLPEPALDLCVHDGRLYALTCGAYGIRWTLRRRAVDGWREVATLAPEADLFRALACSPRGATVVTSRRAFVERSGKVRSVRLSRPLPRSVTAVAHAVGPHVLVGLDMGEFGGSLHRIDASTGAIEEVGPCGESKPCIGGVHAMADEPWKRGCVAAAGGVAHLGQESGRLVEVCGDAFRPMAPGARTAPGHGANGADSPFSTRGFFGVARVGGSIVASGSDALYRVNALGFELRPLPEFRVVGRMEVSFAVPGVILVKTDMSRRSSTGGATTMVVAR